MPLNSVTKDVISAWSRFALQQVAAESYFQGIDLGAPIDLIREELALRLQRGNTPFDPANPTATLDQFVALTPSQATDFVNRYLIVEQHLNDSSGFSAILIKDNDPSSAQFGKFTLAIRSTEYKNPSQGGDYDRDGYFGADGQINQYGFAFGQLAALEEYYAALRSDPERLAGAGPINVVGYSLSGNLALTFTELHPQDVIGTYVFNAAGRGKLLGVPSGQQIQKLSEALTYYREVLLNPDAAGPSVRKSPAYQIAKQLYARDGTNFQPFQSADPNDIGVTRPNLYLDARHLWAMHALDARFRFDFSRPLFSSAESAGSTEYTQAAKVTQLFGHANFGDSERVANSGIHPEATSIFIEGQPFVEGTAGKLPMAPEISAFNAPYGDFGNTHSLTLIVDSLAAMEVFMSAAPNLTKRQVEAIFSGASNQRASAFGRTGKQNQTAEGNSLELAIDGLRKLYGATGSDATGTNNIAYGEVGWTTQSDPSNGGFGDRENRAILYEHLKRLRAAIAVKGTVTIQNLLPESQFATTNGEPISETGPISLAQVVLAATSPTDANGIAYRYSLKELLPFVAIGDVALFAPNNQNGVLDLVDPATGDGLVTSEWVKARAEMLAVSLQLNRDNATFQRLPGVESIKYDASDVGQTVYSFGLERILAAADNEVRGRADVASRHERTFAPTLYSGSGRIVFFGGSGNDSKGGGKADDKLFGGDGSDVLRGFEGVDYLEGGRDKDTIFGGDGADILVGGKGEDDRLHGGFGFDTYRWSVGDGVDIIEDAIEKDGEYVGKRAGKIAFAGAEDLSGVKTLVSIDDDKLFRDVAENRYRLFGEHGSDGTLVITAATGVGGLRIVGFKDGDFGIILDPAGYQPTPVTEVQGTFDDDNNFSVDDPHNFTLFVFDPDQRMLGLDGDDRIKVYGANSIAMGGLGDDVLLNGPNDQLLFGEEGDDILLASAGDDELDGGIGDDVLQGGIGDDYLDGGPEDATVVSSTESDHDLIDGGPGSDVIIGGDGNDLLVGGGNLVPTAHVLGYDHTIYSYGYKRQLDGRMRIENIAGYKIEYLDPFIEFESWPYVADGYFNVDGDLADFIDGGRGDDFVLAGDGDDVVLGGSGADLLVGQVGDDYVQGGTGDDTLMGDGSRDNLVYDGGVNIVYAFGQYHGADTLFGDEGNDVLYGDGGADELYGGDGNDELVGDASADKLEVAYHGDDYLDGGAGEDVLFGYGGDDVLFGGEANDELYGDGTLEAVPFANHGDDYLDGEGGDDTLVGGGGSDHLFGGDGSDTLAGDADDVSAENHGADYLDGELGDDRLQGYGGDDTLIAGRGDDTLAGGKGDDRYLVELGDGDDTIIDGSGTNTVAFGEGITAADLTLAQGLDPQGLGYLVINYSASDSLAIQGGFNGIQLFEFSDGKTLSPFTLYRMLASASTLPTVSGGGGNDTLPTGPLSQVVLGGSGDDSYTVSRGSGWSRVSDQTGASDRIVFDASVSPEHVRFLRRANGDLEVAVLDAEDPLSVSTRVSLTGQFLGGENRIETFEFGDGTLVQASDLDTLPLAELEGTAADDELVGDLFTGQTFSAGEGTDTLAGGSGDDVYRYAKGDGSDVVIDSGGIDRIEFAAGVAREDVLVERRTNEDLVLTLDDGGSITFTGQFLDPSNPGIDEIRFSDGTTIDAAQLASTPVTPEFGTEEADTIDGGQSDDMLYGFGGDDVMEGGVGADTIVAGAGNDDLIGGAGDDLMAGEDGADSYRLGYGTGRDTLVDDSPQTNRLVLNPGIAFGSLRTTRTGDDLEIAIRGASDGVLLAGYFASQQSWSVEDSAGDARTPEALLAETEALEQDQRNALKLQYIAVAKANFTSGLLSQGYDVVGDGLLANDVYSPAYAHFTVADQATERTTTPVNGTPSTTNWTDHFSSWNTIISSGFSNHDISQFQTVTVTSDDAFIDSPEITRVVSPDVVTSEWVQAQWTTISQTAPVQANYTNVGTITYTDPNTGQLVLLATYVDHIQHISYVGDKRGDLSPVPEGVTPYQSPFGTFNPPFRTVAAHHVTRTDTLYSVEAGAGDNTIVGGAIVDAGAGDDIVFSNGLVFGGDGNDQLTGAGSLYGDAGDDVLFGAGSVLMDGGSGNDTLYGGGSILIGGEGSDLLQGEAGVDWYVVRASEAGDDLVFDNGAFDSNAYFLWYYQQLGFEDSLAYLESGGTLPPLSYPGALDFGALQPLYDLGIVDSDVVEFADGILISGIELSWGVGIVDAGSGIGLAPRRTLDIDIGAGQRVRVAIPNAEDAIGLGVERFQFNSDGVILTLEELLSLAPPMPAEPVNVILGTELDDVLFGTLQADEIQALGGNDRISAGAGNDVLRGGDGSDTLDGESGSDRFAIASGELGTDVIADSGSDSVAYLEWYYGNRGSFDWRERGLHAGQFRVRVFGDGDEGSINFQYFDTYEEAENASSSGQIVQIQALTDFAPVITRNDVAAIEALTDAGVITRDVIEVGPGIALADLELTVTVSGVLAESHPEQPWYGGGTLSVRWSDGGFDVDVPDVKFGLTGSNLLTEANANDGDWMRWGDYRLGEGIEAMVFADGSSYSLEALLQFATVNFINGYEFLRDSGYQLIEGIYTGVDFGPDIAPSDIYAFRSGTNLYFGVISDSALGLIPGWYASPAAIPDWEFRFDDGTVLDADAVTRLGLTQNGDSSTNFLFADPDFPSALIGHGGSDYLTGGDGNDLLDGGTENDSLTGGSGNDIYLFGAGYGVDMVNEATNGTGIDTVRFDASVAPGSVSVERDFDMLILTVGGSGDAVWLSSWFDEPGGRVEAFEFADGTTWNAAAVEALLPVVPATVGDDQVVGGTGADVLDGLEGNDEVLGFAGNDTLRGGPGIDVLYGNSGDDTYLFGLGDGADLISDTSGNNVLQFGAGIEPQSVGVTRDDSTLFLVVGETGDRVGILDWFYEAQPQIAQVTFGDGTTWNVAELVSRIGLVPATGFDDLLWGSEGVDTIDGLAGADSIYGNGGDDVLDGGVGDDSIEGGAGNNFIDGGDGDDYLYQEGHSVIVGGTGNDWIDVYGPSSVVAFNPGDGADTIYVVDSFTLSIGGGIGPQDLSLSPDGDDIVLSIGATDSVRLSRQWEADPQAWPVITLQLFGSVHTYDFNAAIADFYAALGADPSLTEFGLGTVLPGHETALSETDAFGGAIAHQYATLGTTGGLTNAQILSALQDPNFGAAPQSIAVTGGNSSPVVANPLADIGANEDAAFAHAISGDAFSDPDAADTLTYSATLGDGSALPAWLSFDAETRSFSGTPLQADVGTTDVKVTASDGGGLSAEDTFTLTVANVNDAPIVSLADGQLLLNDSILAAALFSIFDEDGQSPTQYQFWDDVAGGGRFEVNGIEQGAAAAIAVSAADLANTEYLAGTAPGTERVWARAYDGAAWSAWKSWNMTSALHIPNAAPEATPTAATQTVLLGQSLDASALFSVLDADGDPAVRFEFWDSTAANGHFTVNGVEQAVDAAIAVSSEDLADTAFVGASEAGSDLVWVRATDGQSFGAWKNWTMNSWPHATNAAPVADAANGEVLRDQAVLAQSLFSVTDVNGDAIAQYEFWDDTAGGGYFDVARVAQLNNPIPISAAQLADVTYVGGADPGTEQVWVRANDGMQWGAWESWNMTTALHIPNAAPEATPTAATQTVLLGSAVDASALFSITDADGDPVARYEFWDSTTGIGHFAVGGVEQGVNIAIAVDAADLTGTQFVGGASTGYDLVWVRASDGQTWSDWKSWTMNSWPHASNAAPVVTAADTTLLTSEVVTADSLFDVSDADGDATAQYEFWDDVNGGGYWRVNGVQQGAAQTIAVAAGDLAGTDYVGGASGGTERVWVRASDGLAWSAWKPWNITTALHIPNAAPVVTASDSTLLLGQSIDAGSLFSVTDGDSDPITQYEFWDSTNGGGHFTVNGVEQGVNVAIAVTAAQLADTDFAGANATASDLVWVRANDGQTWSAWKSWTVSSWPHLTNSAPVVSAQTGGVLRSEAIPAAMLFGVSDADGDAIAQYEFWDDVNGGGRFEVNGVQQAAGQSIVVSAVDLANTTYVGSANPGTEQVWVRANDGLAWGAWKNWLMSTEGGMLRGGSGPDTLNGDAGPTALEGGGGNDTLTDLDGDNLFSGGEGDDAMTGGDGDDLFAGGSGNDTINTGAGSNIIAYNAGGGVDTVIAAAGAANTLSFGGGIGYDDLSLSKDGNDLIVSAGVNDRVVLKDWYAGSNNVLDLQIILDAAQEFDANSSDPLYNRKVQNFNFAGLVGEFDAALAQSPGLTSWAMTNALLQFHLSGADDAALGGDLAYWYGKNGGFTGISLNAAQQVIGAPGFGSEAQTLRPFSGLQEGLVRLA